MLGTSSRLTLIAGHGESSDREARWTHGKLQYLLYADGNQSLLVVLQALDGGGKDGVVRHVFSANESAGNARLWLQATQ